MRIITYQLLGSLLLFLMVTSCSRPVAYFQPNLWEYTTHAPVHTEPINVALSPLAQTPTEEVSPAKQLAKANSAFDELNALVSNNRKLAAKKTVQKRLSRVRALLASASTKTGVALTETVALRKMTFMERMMVKKMNKRISRQLAPTNPERTLASKSILLLGGVLLLGGILLLTLTSGGGFALGAIALAAGLVILLIELL